MTVNADEIMQRMLAAGIDNPPQDFVADGAIHRFASTPGRKATAWYIIHDDLAGAVWWFGDWRTGIKEKGNGSAGHELTPDEIEERDRRLRALQAKIKAETERFQAGAAIEARERWDAAQPAPADHGYLRSKSIAPSGARVEDGRLLIAMRDTAGKIWSLQEIAADGFKHNQEGARRKGCFFEIGEITPLTPFCIAEGFATAATLHMATGYPVMSAGDAGNLEAVARALRDEHPSNVIFMCGDDDWFTTINGKPHNTGKLAAEKAARAIGAVLTLPWFPTTRPKWAKDFNDMAKLLGLSEVATRLRLAKIEHDERGTTTAASRSLRDVIAVFDKWLELSNDHTAIYAVVGTVAANLLPGDPVWLGVIAPPSSAKTEILNALLRLPHIEPTATVTPAALLSGTPKKQRDKGAKGGLLQKIGEFGILVLKDFGSILSMRPEAKAEILAALREIYDGTWTRHVGTDGGMTLSWRGKVGLVFGGTQSYDDHHSVIGALGDRFLLCRLPSLGRGQLNRVLDHTGAATKVMRQELQDAVAALFANKLPEPPKINDAEIQRLDDIVSLAVLLRAHVNRDRYRREIESIHGAEGVGRMGLSLERLLAGLTAIGVDRAEAMRIVEDIALDSTPPVRRHAFELLDETPVTTRTIANALKLPTNTARRALEDLLAHGLAIRTRGNTETGEEKQGGADLWRIDPEWAGWRAAWASKTARESKGGCEM